MFILKRTGRNMMLILVLVIISCLLSVINASPISIVASVRGKKYDVVAETVDEVIQQVELLAGLEPGSQNALFRGKVLSSSDRLEDVGLSSGDVLNVVKRRLQRVSKPDIEAEESTQPSNFGDDFDPANYRKAMDQVSPEEMQKAMQAMKRRTSPRSSSIAQQPEQAPHNMT